MLIKISRDYPGVIAKPVNQKHQKKIAKYVSQFDSNQDGSLFFQDIEEMQYALELSNSQISDVENGWDVKVRIDSWNYLTMIGYDANEKVKL